MSLCSLTVDSLLHVVRKLPYESLPAFAAICKEIRDSVDSQEGGWTAVVEARTTRFMDGFQYVSTPASHCWYRKVHTYIVRECRRRRSRNASPKRKGRMVIVDGRRFKVRNRKGVEFVYLQEKLHWQTLWADSTEETPRPTFGRIPGDREDGGSSLKGGKAERLNVRREANGERGS